MSRPVAREARVTRPARRAAGLDLARIRADFPLLSQRIHGKRLTYLDNAATSQKPRHVIEAVRRYYEETNANVHRAVHSLSERATAAYEGARGKVQRFINAADPREIIFVRGATEAINLVAHSVGQARLRPGDEVLVSAMEHHSNIVPWQLACQERGATLRVIPMTRDGELVLSDLDELLNDRTRMLAVVHVSNSLGTVNPVAELIHAAKGRGVPVLIDGAQAAPHFRIDVQQLGVDFYTISGHKMFGPTGIGVLYGRADLLEELPPFQGGGDMIRTVTFERTTYAAPPHKFEAGTPNIAGAVGLGAAIDYLGGFEWDLVEEHERDVLAYAVERVAAAPGVRLIGAPVHRAGVVAFVMDAAHAHDVGTIVDQAGVAIRTGHHCTQPVMDFYGVPATARASFAFYNGRDDVDALVDALEQVRRVFS